MSTKIKPFRIILGKKPAPEPAMPKADVDAFAAMFLDKVKASTRPLSEEMLRGVVDDVVKDVREEGEE